MSLNELVKEAYCILKEHGFHEEDSARDIPIKLALIHSETSEALEHYRNGNNGHLLTTIWADAKGKPDGFAIELADIIIRVADLAGMFDIDLDEAVQQKMDFNKNRPHKHGGKKC